jgi:hypothetical protein
MCIISRCKEGENSAAAVSKVHHLAIQKQKSDATNTQTPKIRSHQHIQNSNFRFKSREKRTRGSERCEKDRTAMRGYVDIDAVHLYLAGKASCWHAGVLLAAPTVKILMTMDNAIAVAFSCLFQHKQAQRFAPLDRACKD